MADSDIISAARRYAMFEPGDRVVVAVSGGPDSIAVLHALRSRSSEFGISMVVAHLNHCLRGESSETDAEFVREIAKTWGLEAAIGKTDVRRYCSEHRAGIEEAARDARHRFLLNTYTNLSAQKIALGHTADDRVESVLMNLLRGTGTRGLGSIRPIRGPFVRPMIDASRAEVMRYVEAHGLPYRVDESNQDTAFTRNRIRRELLPLLERDYNPSVRQALLRLAEIADSDSEFIASEARSVRGAVDMRGAIDAGLLAAQPRAVRLAVVRAEIEAAKGNTDNITFEQIDAIDRGLRSGRFTITLPPGDIEAVLRDGLLRIRRRAVPRCSVSFDTLIEVPGTTHIKEIGCRIDAEFVAPESRRTPPNEAMIDVAQIHGALRARSLRPGDRIAPLGMTGSKKLQDVFVDKKIPLDKRRRVAVIVDDEKLIWVAGVVFCEQAKITSATKNALHLAVSFTSA